ncbi:PKD domain-containing protein [Halogeometricum sp. S1BR25-6]|uniref:PKD domain-containing protein n=1 Tax=Halogeometricum salsisoli TaxID=2950536 RepID=A0ABU2GKU7_9EURY|nr:PKD domain-containing protein [Halogeometricum sp. S1BR25-6]MDS0300904.1 PKD domain-containing protein [Halogeometricum sp. S1BR25-6]
MSNSNTLPGRSNDREESYSSHKDYSTVILNRRSVIKGAGITGLACLSGESVSAQSSSPDNPSVTTSFETENVGDPSPADPFYLFNDGGAHRIEDDTASDGDQSFYTANAHLGDPSAIAIDLDLSKYTKIKLDVFTARNNPNWGNMKIWLDGAGYNNPRHANIWTINHELNKRNYSPYKDTKRWYNDCEVDLSEYEGKHAVTFWVDGDNGAYWDNIRFIPGESETGQAPSPAFSVLPTSPETSQSVTFDASESTDPDGSISSYEWDITGGIEIESQGVKFDHTFDTPDEYEISLRVTDDDGQTAESSQVIDVQLLRGPEKQEIASDIDERSLTSLNDEQRVEAAIDELSAAVREEELDTQTAENTVERLVAGEQVTKRVLSHIGPHDTELGSGANLTRAVSKPVLTTALNLYIGAKAKSATAGSSADFLSLGGAGGLLQSLGNSFVTSNIFDLLDWFFGSFDKGKNEAKKGIKNHGEEIVTRLANAGDVTQENIEEEVENAVEIITEGIAANLRAYFEQSIPTWLPTIDVPDISVSTTLDYLHSSLNFAKAKTGLNGTTESAQAAKRRKLGEIDSKANQVSDDIQHVKDFQEKANLVSSIADLFDGSASLMDAFEAFVSIANTVVGSFTAAFNVGMGLQGLAELQIQNAIATFLIVNGRETL